MSTCISTSQRMPAYQADNWQQQRVHTANEINGLCEGVSRTMTAAGYASRDVFAVRLALEEAVINAIKHGHQCDPRKTVRIDYRVNGERVLINVEDEGPGFDPREIADPLSPENLDRSTGRGLLLMRHYMTWVKYDSGGNRVSLCKCRTC